MRILLRILLVVTCAFLAATAAHAAAWSRTYGSGIPSSVRQTADGGYILAGQTGSGAWLMKLDASGNATWTRVVEGGGVGPGSTSLSATLVEPAADGGYTVLGNVHVSSIWQPTETTWISKLDGSGNSLWGKAYAGVGHIWSAQPTADGGFVAAGTRYVAPDGYEALVLKFGAGGDLVWRAILNGNQQDIAHFVRATSDGGAVVAGHTFPSSAFGSVGPVDAWVAKLDGQGQIVWQKTYGGTGYDFADFVSPTPDGGYVAVGRTDSFGAGKNDVWVWKLDASGGIVWQRTYGGFDADYLSAVHSTEDGGFVVAGSTHSFGAGDSDAWVFKINAAGDMVWQETFGGTGYDEARYVAPTADGGYIIAGNTSSNSLGSNASGAWVLKLDANGAINGCSIMNPSSAGAVLSHATVQEGSLYGKVSYAPPYIESSFPWSDAEIAPSQQCYDPAPASRLTAVEYYYRTFDHYFLTTLPREIAALDAGALPGWVRTGKSFQTYGLDPAAASVCRFWSGQTFAPKSSHFYTPYSAECAYLKQQGVWQYEGDVFGLGLPAGPPGQGTCGTAMQPLYRAYNNGMSGAPNHRYTTDPAVLDAMLAQGWIMEGEASTRVFACVPTQ